MSDEPISEESFAEAKLRFSRNVAVILCAALADGGATMEQVDARLGKPRGWVVRVLARLLEGKQNSLDSIGTILWAAGGYVLDMSNGGLSFRKIDFSPRKPQSFDASQD